MVIHQQGCFTSLYCNRWDTTGEICAESESLDQGNVLVCLACPCFDDNGKCTFYGKIGMWPFVEEVEGQRRSDNRPRGTIITRVVSCDKNRYREYLIQKVLPAIRMKWPDRDRQILIQQDRASAHIHDNDAEFNLHARQVQWEIWLETQPLKSPDTNLFDLSFFRALQSAQWGLDSETTIDWSG